LAAQWILLLLCGTLGAPAGPRNSSHDNYNIHQLQSSGVWRVQSRLTQRYGVVAFKTPRQLDTPGTSHVHTGKKYSTTVVELEAIAIPLQ
jgi:hypothetical protein